MLECIARRLCKVSDGNLQQQLRDQRAEIEAHKNEFAAYETRCRLVKMNPKQTIG